MMCSELADSILLFCFMVELAKLVTMVARVSAAAQNSHANVKE